MTDGEFRLLIEESRANQAALARALGVSASLVTLWKCGRRRIPDSRVEEIKIALRRLRAARMDMAKAVVAEAEARFTRSLRLLTQ